MDILGIIVFFFALQGVLYLGPIVALVCAVTFFRHRRVAGGALFAASLIPFGLYALDCIPARLLAPPARDLEVASWPRKPVTPENLPKVLVTSKGWWVAKTLVGAGPFQKAYAKGSDGWYLYERSSNLDCPSASEWQRYSHEQDKLKPTPCVVAATTGPLRLQEPHLLLYFDEDAPSRHRPNDGVVSGSTLELRWSKDAGGELIAYWETPYFDVPRLPPVLLGSKGWQREAHYSPRRYQERPEPRTFVAKAIGMSTVGPQK